MPTTDPALTAQPDGPAKGPTNSAADPAADTVADAAATPDLAQPYADLGLTDDEYQGIREVLGRRPTAAELAMYSVMWSEHCSYKSSKRHLGQFGAKTTPEMRENLLVGMGQNAGVVDIGDGWAVTFKVESHNSPSFVEPYQGAATGVGGIVRDIISMGARPIGVMDQLRFGDVNHPDTQRIVHGVVAGVGGYGNSLGLPNIGGETEFDPAYQRNPLVNALCVGALRRDGIHLANASGAGNKVVLFGARTGGDGIGGASVLSSQSFDADGPTKRPSVQVGDPFMEKLLIECCLELFSAGVVEAIQDLGAAGISCATSELAANGDGGMHVDLETVLLRDHTLTAGEILMSESQERMMAVVTPENLEAFLAIAGRWDVETAVIGEVSDTDRLTIDHHGHRIVDVDPSTVANGGPIYDRPYAEPAWQAGLNADRAEDLPRPATPEELREQVLTLISSPNLASKEWVTSQYDRYVQGNTAMATPDDAGVIRVDEQTGLGIALATDANGRFTKLDPYTGAQLGLAEAYRNVACVGARPVAISDCLNFGSPEDPDAMWQLVQAITGLADGCAELGVPVTGGNVSLYNSTESQGSEAGHIDASLNPTPVTAMLGVIDDVSRATPSGWRDEGLSIYLLGTTRTELSGSEWARAVHTHLGGHPPIVDLDAERTLAETLVASSRDGLVDSAHDLSNGGLIQALVESVLRHGTGARVVLDELIARDGIDAATALFSESAGRALVAMATSEEPRFADLCSVQGVPALRIGVTDDSAGDPALEVQGAFRLGLEELRVANEGVLEGIFG